MRSFTSSSEVRFIGAFLATFCVLAACWESILRQRAGAAVGFAVDRPQLAPPTKGERWVVFGNCLVMTGISPKQLGEELSDRRERYIVNIAAHEQSPTAFFAYLRRAGQYPDLIIANVSSWLNGTNFDQEAEHVVQMDPLALLAAGRAAPTTASAFSGRSQGDERSRFQDRAETALADAAGDRAKFVGHRYHLFDYSLFLTTLLRTADLDESLYQLNLQSWFRVTGSDTDGRGFVSINVEYRDDWSTGLARMAEKSLQRMRLSRLLTPAYWELLESDIKDFRAHGTRVVLVRMPEHPEIRSFNERTYDVTSHLRQIEDRTGTQWVDLSHLGTQQGVYLFDAVHPDAKGARVITHELSSWLRARSELVDARTSTEPRSN